MYIFLDLLWVDRLAIPVYSTNKLSECKAQITTLVLRQEALSNSETCVAPNSKQPKLTQDISNWIHTGVSTCPCCCCKRNISKSLLGQLLAAERISFIKETNLHVFTWSFLQTMHCTYTCETKTWGWQKSKTQFLGGLIMNKICFPWNVWNVFLFWMCTRW